MADSFTEPGCSSSQFVALCLYKDAIYHAHMNGTWKKISESSWNDARGACYVGNNQIFCLYKEGTYLVNAITGKYRKLTDDIWNGARELVYLENDRALCLYSKGIYRINTQTGMYTKLTDNNWSDSRGMVYCGDDKAFCLYKEGTYLINTVDGSYKKLTSDSWNGARGICYLGNDLALCIYRNGMYHINTTDGMYTKLCSPGGWEESRGICYMGNNRALALYKNGMYAINTRNGHWQKLSESSWDHARGVCCIYLKTDETYDMLSRIPDIESVCDDNRLNELVKIFREQSLHSTSALNKLQERDLADLGLKIGEKLIFRSYLGLDEGRSFKINAKGDAKVVLQNNLIALGEGSVTKRVNNVIVECSDSESDRDD